MECRITRSITRPNAPTFPTRGACSHQNLTPDHPGAAISSASSAPQAGNHQLAARVATVQDGQLFLNSANDAKPNAETPVPSYTLGMWKDTPPVEVTLAKGKNILDFELRDGSARVTIKDFTLKPAN